MSVPLGSRAFWTRQFRLWHWVSAAISLAGMLLFAVTGLTLNNARLLPNVQITSETVHELPGDLLELVAALPGESEAPLPAELAAWIARELKVNVTGRPTETSEDEVYIPLALPGADGWIAIDRAGGELVHRHTDRGWLAYLNDLHKGRNTGTAWSWFIDFLAIACVIFTLTGLGLLWMHSAGRRATWPLGWASLAIPMILALIFIH